MLLPNEYKTIVSNLYDISGPIIRYRIDSEFYQKKCSITDYIKLGNNDIPYWINVHKKNKIHGKDDECFENAMSKLLDYGFTKDNFDFNKTFGYILDDSYWHEDDFTQIIVYPFLVRAGYLCNKNVFDYYKKRIQRIGNTIEKYSYNFRDTEKISNSKYCNEFRFINDWIYEPLPTIYDLYACAYSIDSTIEFKDAIERIVKYVLHSRFQEIPDKAYVYDKSKKRYYAAGSIYHACFREERELLEILLFSHFQSIQYYEPIMNKIRALLNTKDKKGFYCFKQSLLKEHKNAYQIYSGAHMGLGEDKKKKGYLTIESTFTMLKILSNLYKNNILL